MLRERRIIRCAAAARNVLAALFLPLPFIASALGQQVTGNLQGQLPDSLGQPLSSVNIVVRGRHVQGVRGIVSDEDGFFAIPGLPPGTVSVTMSHVSYQTIVFENVSIQMGKTTDLREIRLHAHPHDLPEVVVSGMRPMIDPGTTYSGANLRATDFENLPVERNYRNIAALIPEANASFFG